MASRNEITGMLAEELASFVDCEWDTSSHEQNIAVIVALSREVCRLSRELDRCDRVIRSITNDRS